MVDGVRTLPEHLLIAIEFDKAETSFLANPMTITYQNVVNEANNKKTNAISSWLQFLNRFVDSVNAAELKIQAINSRVSNALIRGDIEICDRNWTINAYAQIKLSKTDVYAEFGKLISEVSKLKISVQICEYKFFESVLQMTPENFAKSIKSVLKPPKYDKKSGGKALGTACHKFLALADDNEAKVRELINCYSGKYQSYLNVRKIHYDTIKEFDQQPMKKIRISN